MSTATQAPSTVADPLGYAFAIGGAVLFSSKAIFIKLAYAQGAATEVLLALRMLVALPVYLVILLVLLRRNPKLLGLFKPRLLVPAMLVGLLGYYVSSYLDFAALNLISAQYGRLVLFTYPFFVVLFGAMFFRVPFSWRILPGMLIAYGGIVLLFGWSFWAEPDGLLIGTALVLTAAVTFAFYQLLAKGRMRELGTALFTCIAMSTAAVFAIGQSLLITGPQTLLSLPQPVWLLGLALGIFSTVLPSFMMNAAIARIGARANSSTAAFGPLLTIGFAVVVLSEPFTIYHALGTALVLLGATLFARAERRLRGQTA
jgi:drug/metabolite transporter (DMT)-like permease